MSRMTEGGKARMTEGEKQESRVSESLSLLLSVIPDPDRGSRQGKNPWSLCSCRGGIPGQSPGHASCRPKRLPRNGKRHETEGRMRCGHYRGGVPGGIRGRGYGRGGDRSTEGGMRCRHYRRGGGGETPHALSVILNEVPVLSLSKEKISRSTTERLEKQIPSFDRPFAKLRAYSGQALRSE